MSRPLCTRIEITYADGSINSAAGSNAEQILQHLEIAQAALRESNIEYKTPPQLRWQPKSESFTVADTVIFGACE